MDGEPSLLQLLALKNGDTSFQVKVANLTVRRVVGGPKRGSEGSGVGNEEGTGIPWQRRGVRRTSGE